MWLVIGKKMLQVLGLVNILFVICVYSDVPRPRGVPLSKVSLYSPTKDFTCLDGSITIPFSYVNDDYCDCFDGSDEPGTAACLNGVFHCTNAGHRAQNIPSSRVNDGICDCCDGTDEYASTICGNTCEELGKEARAEAQRLSELYKAGSVLRQELIERGNKKRSEMAEQLTQLENDKDDAEKFKAEKESLKNELETVENEVLKVYREAEEKEKLRKAELEKEAQINDATEHFTRYDANSDGLLSVNEINVVNVFDKNKDGQVDGEEFQYFFGEQETVDKNTFISTTWPLLKPLIMMEQGIFHPATDNKDLEQAQEEDIEQDLDNENLGEDESSDLDQQEEAQEEEEEEEDEGRLPEVEEDQTKGYDEETQKIVAEATEARRQFTEAERTVREIDSKIRNIKQNLEKDYGPQQEYATLEGQCLEYEDKEYIYRLCLFDKTTQKSKNGGSEIGLGNWGEWEGTENNRYAAMKYTNGIACWNGPSRTTTVIISCGIETTILSVTEPHRCEYQMELSTPAACDDSNRTQQQSSHDEL